MTNISGLVRLVVQRFSWVHRDDLVSLIMESLTNPAYEGKFRDSIYAPNQLPNTSEIQVNVSRFLKEWYEPVQLAEAKLR